ncbi:hypothetical protein MES4922_190436 [Mesorhizobium ventifaucium]|uniref:Uncharacterized protein n=1 Tax=Mesorhizobium ventifaucium TaxID=666020 RepID=A0ABN8JJG2_9HYPH|nr:hypothetical protein MES4922_190436 [Mesorhizobium ventifaucium]
MIAALFGHCNGLTFERRNFRKGLGSVTFERRSLRSVACRANAMGSVDRHTAP